MPHTIDILLEAEQLEGTQAVLSNWLVKAGDKVVKDQPIVDLETDKVAIEVTAPESGIIQQIIAQQGEQVAADQLLATLSTKISAAAEANRDITNTPLNPAELSCCSQTTATPIPQKQMPSKSHLLGPAVKRLLSQHQIDPTVIKGTGQAGRISKRDVLHFIESAHSTSAVPVQTTASDQTQNANSTLVPHTAMRSAIADHMVSSLLKTSPHVTSVFEMDLSAIIEHRKARKLGYQDAGANLTFTAYFLLASARAIQQVPEINSRFHDHGLEIFKQINIGVGTALADKGLVVPVVQDVANLSLFEIASKLTEQTEKARTRQLSASDMQGGTFTISNYGVSGSLLATPIIINQPQVAILGVGKMEKRVVVRSIDGEDQMQIKPMCYVSLSIDHRALDAYQTNQFLNAFVDIIHNWPTH